MKSSEREHGNARYRRRTWNHRKSYLPKYTSLPELHLLPAGQRPLFRCQRCGFINTLIPLCLWCTWTSQEAEHEFESTTPRARRASAPAKVFFHVELTSPQIQRHKYHDDGPLEHPGPHDLTRLLIGSPGPSPVSKFPMSSSLLSLSPQSQKQGLHSQPLGLRKSQSIMSPCVPLGNTDSHSPMTTQEDLHHNDGDRVTAGSSKGNPISSLQRPKRLGVRRRESYDREVDVPTATLSRSSLVFAQAQTPLEESDTSANATSSRHSNSIKSLRDPLLHSHPLPSEEQVYPSAPSPATPPPAHQRRSSSPPSLSPSPSLVPMKSMKSFRTLKPSRRMLIIDAHDAANTNAKSKPQPIHAPNNVPNSIPSDNDEHGRSNHDHEQLTSTNILNTTSKPSSSITSDILPSPQRQQNQMRTLRRKKHFNVMQSSILPLSSDGGAAEVQPIAISLNLRASQRDLQKAAARSKSPLRPQSSHIQILPKRKPSQPLCVVAAPSESGSSDLASPPLTPTLAVPPPAPPAPPSTAPTGLSTSFSLSPLPSNPASTSVPMEAKNAATTPTTTYPSSPSSSPVRLGHPSRPYYSAIRKGGISSSPPNSRPTSLSGPSPSSPLSSSPTSTSGSNSRPKSYTPPSSTLLNHFSSVTTPANASAASRHLSMSAMFIGPPAPPHSSPFSVFSVLDDEDEDGDDLNADDGIGEDGMLPPTPSPGLVSFSLSAASRRLSGSRTGPNPFPHLLAHSGGHGHGHRQTMSLSSTSKSPSGSGGNNANANAIEHRHVHRNTIGFSMSGETELRMALAAAAASGGGGGGVTESSSQSGGRANVSASTSAGGGFTFKFRECDSLSQPSASGVLPDDAEFGLASSAPLPAQARISRDLDSHAGSSNSFMGRVKRLRKGLKEMMLLSAHAHD